MDSKFSVERRLDICYNTISFCRDSYMEYYDCLNKKCLNEAKLFEDISAFIKIATQNGYQMKIWDDGLTIVVEYNHQDETLSEVSLEWLDENEYVVKCNEEKEDNE